MPVRVPIDWSDESLIEDEPFSSLFKKRANQTESRRRKGGSDEYWTKIVIEELKKDPSYKKTLRTWLAFVFEPIPGAGMKTPQQQSINASNEDENLKLFVDVYWQISRGWPYAMVARSLVQEARKKAGLVYALPVTKLESGGSTFPVSVHSRRKKRSSEQSYVPTDEPNFTEVLADSGSLEEDNDVTIKLVSQPTGKYIEKDREESINLDYLMNNQSEDDKGFLSMDDVPEESGPYIPNISDISGIDICFSPKISHVALADSPNSPFLNNDSTRALGKKTWKKRRRAKKKKRRKSSNVKAALLHSGSEYSTGSSRILGDGFQTFDIEGDVSNDMQDGLRRSNRSKRLPYKLLQDQFDTGHKASTASSKKRKNKIKPKEKIEVQQTKTPSMTDASDCEESPVFDCDRFTGADKTSTSSPMDIHCAFTNLDSDPVIVPISLQNLMPVFDSDMSDAVSTNRNRDVSVKYESAGDSYYRTGSSLKFATPDIFSDVTGEKVSINSEGFRPIVSEILSISKPRPPVLDAAFDGHDDDIFYSNFDYSGLKTKIPAIYSRLRDNENDSDDSDSDVASSDANFLIQIRESSINSSHQFLICDSFDNINEPFCPEKPDLPTSPPIWASSRQDLCESFPYFRSYQSGVYHTKGIAKGYLLSAFSSVRDIFHNDGKLIISHGGGSTQILRINGQLISVISDDQDYSDSSVRALLNTHQKRVPVVLIVDDKYRLFPYSLGRYTYAVLGFYWITCAWAEPVESDNERGYCIKYKFCFQWCESQGEPWWIQVPSSEGEFSRGVNSPVVNDPLSGKIDDVDDISDAIHDDQVCPVCRNPSPIVYEHGWACLRPRCSNFWRPQVTLSATLLESPGIVYSEDFLTPRKTPRSLKYVRKIKLRPTAPVRNGITTSEMFSKGWWCPQCGKLSCREKWECWDCSSCGNIVNVTGRPREPKEFWYQQHNLRFMHDRIHGESGITRLFRQWQSPDGISGSMLSYTFPDRRGTIHLILGNPLLNREADEIFRLYQTEALERPFLRRYPLQSHALRGRMLANYFSQNSGVPYKYVAGTGSTTPFESAPSAVTAALKLIKERSAIVLGKTEEFNEILSAAYMEKQKMAFHSDNEPGLGPVVCSLSLGSVAVMHFRLQSTLICPDEPRRRVLTLALRHGDVLIMDGSGLQTKYEHTVIPMDFRIAATARQIHNDAY